MAGILLDTVKYVSHELRLTSFKFTSVVKRSRSIKIRQYPTDPTASWATFRILVDLR